MNLFNFIFFSTVLEYVFTKATKLCAILKDSLGYSAPSPHAFVSLPLMSKLNLNVVSVKVSMFII